MYLARKGNIQFHVQDEEIEKYADNGYTILNEACTEVTNVAAEAAAVSPARVTSAGEAIGGAINE